MKYYVFRINYDDEPFKIIRGELIFGRLRQGWGAPGISINQAQDEYREAWRRVWPNDPAQDTYINRKYQNLRLMAEIQPGDFIIIPRVGMDRDRVDRFFSVARCEQSYAFDPIDIGSSKIDCGHIITVKPLFSCSYDHNAHTRTISGKFKAYQNPVNNVYNEDCLFAIQSLIEKYEQNPFELYHEEVTSIQALSEDVQESR